jgi:hypothetical protein
MDAQAERVFPVFIGVWAVLGIFSAGFFLLNNNATLKRKVWPPFVIGVGVLFLGFVALMGFPLEMLFIMAPAVVLITFLNLRSVKFCNACGKTLMSQNPLTPPKYCSRCGASLDDEDA